MSSIDQLLERAQLIKGHQMPADVIPSAPYGCGRCACACEADDDYAYSCTTSQEPAAADSLTGTAAGHLTVLCEAVVNRTATAALTDLVTETLPAPRGARLVGCILQLADSYHHARMWWQYAAGAGDVSAGYLLYLHHLSRGEQTIADWWLDQTGIDPHAQEDTVLVDNGIRHAGTWKTEGDLATILRVLTRLVDPEAPSRREELVSTVVDYVVSAVAADTATNPGQTIPLPPDFAEHLDVILTPAPRPGTIPRRSTRRRVLVGNWLEPFSKRPK